MCIFCYMTSPYAYSKTLKFFSSDFNPYLLTYGHFYAPKKCANVNTLRTFIKAIPNSNNFTLQ